MYKTYGMGPLVLVAGWLGLQAQMVALAEPFAGHTTAEMKLSDLVQRVLDHNESVQLKLLEFEANRHKYLAERGIFEPDLVSSVSHEENNRQNTVEQQLAMLSSTFDEKNNLYDEGLEALVPSGARVRLGYSLSDLHNNLQTLPNFAFRGATNGEYLTFFGVTVTQPLLKNAGFPATMAGIRVAALSSRIAFHEYRRQLMTIVTTAEASYWNLFLAQEQVRFFEESVKTADTLLHDSRTRLEAGKGSDLDVLEAEAGLALRRSKLSEARQRLTEASDRLVSLYSERVTPAHPLLRAADAPELGSELPRSDALAQLAFDLNPDYLIQRQKLEQELVRLGFARNQRLPELNFKGAYGLNGLSDSTGASWDDLGRMDFASWSVGLELRLPLSGGIKARNEWQAAQLQVKSAQVGLRDLGTQIINGIDTAWHKTVTARDTVSGYQASVQYNQRSLVDALARQAAGKLDSRKVLEIEADLLDAKTSVVDSLVQYQRSLLELELLEGVVLQQRHLEVTQDQLQTVTRRFIRSGRITEAQYQQVLQEVQALYKEQIPQELADTPQQKMLRRALRDKEQEAGPPNLPSPPPAATEKDDPQSQKLRQVLHERLKAMEDQEQTGSGPKSP